MAAVPGPRRPGEVARYTVGFARRPHSTLLRLHREFGPVVGFGFGSTRIVGAFGREANEQVLAHDERFRWREAFETMTPMVGETALLLSDGDAHRRRRRLVAGGFTRRSIDSYVPVMAAAADGVLDSLRPGDEVDLHALFQLAIRRATVALLFGARLGAEADRLGELLEPLVAVIDGDALTQELRRRLGTPAWRRAMRARAAVDDRIFAEIARRRRSADDGDTDGDLLTRLMATTDGEGLTDDEVRDQVVSMIVAGYETTSAAMAWVCLHLFGTPEFLARAREEVAAVCGEHPPTADDVRRLSWIDALVSESLRLYPPAPVTGRMVHEGLHLHGHDIPPGTLLMISPLVTHRSPEIWSRADRFVPDRWLDGSRPSPAEYLPFGGGAHRCLGSALAVTELKTMLARLVARVDLDLSRRPVRPISYIAMRPRDGVPARVRALRAVPSPATR